MFIYIYICIYGLYIGIYIYMHIYICICVFSWFSFGKPPCTGRVRLYLAWLVLRADFDSRVIPLTRITRQIQVHGYTLPPYRKWGGVLVFWASPSWSSSVFGAVLNWYHCFLSLLLHMRNMSEGLLRVSKPHPSYSFRIGVCLKAIRLKAICLRGTCLKATCLKATCLKAFRLKAICLKAICL